MKRLNGKKNRNKKVELFSYVIKPKNTRITKIKDLLNLHPERTKICFSNNYIFKSNEKNLPKNIKSKRNSNCEKSALISTFFLK